jgi:tetratricopeptide (TPR) repeat protein
VTESDQQDDPSKRAELLDKAAKDLETAIEMMKRRNENPSSVLLQLGDAYVRLQQFDRAHDAYLQAEQFGLGDNQWQVYQKIADIYGKRNDIAAQRDYLQKAISLAPEDQKASLQVALDLLEP